MKTETPETIAAVDASNGQWSFVLKQACAKIERERDEAIAARKASAADWLNQVEQANARVSRALRQVARAEQERDAARKIAEFAMLEADRRRPRPAYPDSCE